MNKLSKMLAAMLFLGLPVVGHAAPLTAGTLADVLALPDATGTIAGTTFAFNYPQNGVPEYFAGPWANGSYWGPASNITFTPDAADANNPGFTLSGNFDSYFHQYNDVALGVFLVTAPKGMKIDSVTVEIGNPGPAGTPGYQLNASLNSCSAYIGQLSSSCGSWGANSGYYAIDLRFYNYSNQGPVGFDSASFHFQESQIAAVPEPGEWALMVSGLGLMGLMARRRKAS